MLLNFLMVRNYMVKAILLPVFFFSIIIYESFHILLCVNICTSLDRLVYQSLKILKDC